MASRGLKIEAAILKLIGQSSSFEANSRIALERDAEHYLVGRYQNQEPELIFYNKNLMLLYTDRAINVVYADIEDATLPICYEPNWKREAEKDPFLRQVRLEMTSGEIVMIPITGETNSCWDLFEANDLFCKIAFFNRKVKSSG